MIQVKVLEVKVWIWGRMTFQISCTDVGYDCCRFILCYWCFFGEWSVNSLLNNVDRVHGTPCSYIGWALVQHGIGRNRGRGWIEEKIISDIVMAIAGVLVAFGIVTLPASTKEKSSSNEVVEQTHEEENQDQNQNIDKL